MAAVLPEKTDATMTAPVMTQPQHESIAAPAYTSTATPAAPAQKNVESTAGHHGGPIDGQDLQHWTNRANAMLVDVKGTLIQKSAPDARSWTKSFCGCCSPIDLCLMTYCCPCITFGKTHHRMNKNPAMLDYEPINTSCLFFLAAACFGLHWIPESMQRMEMRKKYNLKGSCLSDIAFSCCCPLCDLTQQEKESRVHEQELLTGSIDGKPTQYSSPDPMMKYDKEQVASV